MLVMRGGHKQKRAAETQLQQDVSKKSHGNNELVDSALAAALLQRWAWGKLSAIDVQSLASAAVSSGCGEAGVASLAGLGSHGSIPGNINRDLLRNLGPCNMVPEACKCQVAYMDPKASKELVDQGMCSLLLPHEWLHCLSHDPENQGFFEEAFGVHSLREFWEEQNWLANPKLKNFCFRDAAACEKIIPLVLHGDGGEFQDRDSLNVVSFGGLLNKSGHCLDRLLLMGAWPKSCTVKGNDGTWAAIWKVLVWSLNCLTDGVFPAVDAHGRAFDEGSKQKEMAGKPILKDGYKAIVWSFLADCKFFSDEFGLASASSSSLCFQCQANITDMPYTDFRPQALWRAAGPNTHVCEHIIMGLRGFSVHHFQWDILHVLDLGSAAHVIANCLYRLTYFHFANLPRQMAVDTTWRRILELYDELDIEPGHRVKNFGLKHFTTIEAPTKNFPMLHGLKAAEVKGLVPVCLHMSREWISGDAYHQHRTAMLESLNRFYVILKEADMMPTLEQGQEAEKEMNKFLLMYALLAKKAMQNDKSWYSIVPKFHYCAHLGESVKFLNPAFANCYAGEGFVGHICNLAQACSTGTAGFRLSHLLAEKYRFAMHLRILFGCE